MAKENENFKVVESIEVVELRDPQGRLVKGGKSVGSKLSAEWSADGKRLRLDVKEDNPSPEPLPCAYKGEMTGMYVRPTRSNTLLFNFSIKRDMLNKVSITTVRNEFREASRVLYEYHKHGWDLETGEMNCEDDNCVEQQAA